MITKRMSHLGGSEIRRLFELSATMKNPINLSLGQADFDAPESVKKATIEAIQSGKNRYTVTAGVNELIAAIRAALEREGVHPESIMSVAGASAGLLLALFALAEEGTEVLAADPYFVSYGNLIRITGAEPRWIDTYPDFRLTPERLRAAVTPRSKILIYNSPSNPTGVAYTAAEVQALAITARELGLTVISDEVYDAFSYDFPHECWSKYDPTAILVRSFSKTGGIPGWRAGYVAGPEAIVQQMKILQQFTFVCVNSPAQWGSIAALDVDTSGFRDAYRKKRDFVYESLSSVFDLQKPEGAFYVFPKAPGNDPERFIKRCLERELVIVPGGGFSQRKTHFRVSYALDDATLARGIELLVEIGKEFR